jgi:hypothetical protein
MRWVKLHKWNLTTIHKTVRDGIQRLPFKWSAVYIYIHTCIYILYIFWKYIHSYMYLHIHSYVCILEIEIGFRSLYSSYTSLCAHK